MRKCALSFTMVLVFAFAFGQEQKKTAASFVVLEHQPAAMIVLPYAPSVVMDAMKEYESNAFKPLKKQSAEYQSFYNTALMKNNETGAAVTFQVGPMNQQKDQTAVYLMLNTYVDKGNYTGTVNQFQMTEAIEFQVKDAIEYLDNLSVAVDVIALDRQIKEYTAKLRKVEQKEGHYAKKCDRLEEKKVAIQNKLDQNKKSVINKDHRLDLRLEESQEVFAYHKATAEKQRSDLDLLTKQRSNYR